MEIWEHLQDVQVRHLVALTAVAEEGSFAGAAALLGYSQAAISQQVAGLERILGQRMFDRPGGPRPATLTPAGSVVLRHARQVLDRLEAIGNDLAHLRAGTGGRVVCGTFQSVTVSLLPDLMALMRDEMPGVSLQLYEHDLNDHLLDRLADGDIDVTFVTDPAVDPRADFVALGTDPIVVVTPAGVDPIRKPFPIRDLAGAHLIGQKDSPYQVYVDEGLRAHGVNPLYVFRTNDNSGVQAMVRAGLGLAVMPQLTVDTRDPEIVVRRLEPALAPRTIYVALRRHGTRLPAAERLVALAQRTSRRHLAQVRRG